MRMWSTCIPDITLAVTHQQYVKKTSKFRLLSEWVYVHSHTVTCVGTLHCSRSSSLSCRLQCLALSFFTLPLTPQWKERGCVCLCEKHTWQRRRPPTSSFSTLHPTFFPSLLPEAPREEMDLCLGLVMSLLATLGFRVQKSEMEELSHFVYNECRLWHMHVKIETVSVYRSGIVYSLWSSLFIICFVFKFM